MSQTTRGRFISFEGGEGVGKTTQIQRLAEFLRERGLPVVVTREPGGTTVGERVREILLDRNLPAMHHDTELMLMYAARVEHVRALIQPELAAGHWVLSDRFADASFVYQGVGRGIPAERLAALDEWALQGFRPDLTFLLDMPVEMGMARARKRAALDRFEAEDLTFFARIRQGYLTRAATEPERIVVIDACGSEDAIAQAVRQHLVAWL